MATGQARRSLLAFKLAKCAGSAWGTPMFADTVAHVCTECEGGTRAIYSGCVGVCVCVGSAHACTCVYDRAWKSHINLDEMPCVHTNVKFLVVCIYVAGCRYVVFVCGEHEREREYVFVCVVSMREKMCVMSMRECVFMCVCFLKRQISPATLAVLTSHLTP